MNYLSFLGKLDEWVQKQTDITAAAIAGSYARQTATKASDVDITLLTENPNNWTNDIDWLAHMFPEARDIRTETWGPVTALRFWLDDLEVEFNFTPIFWANIPVDPGTANVVAGGYTLIKDPEGTLQQLIDAVDEGLVVNIRTHLENDHPAIAQLFYDAVHALPDTLYSQAEKAAWAPAITPEVLTRWQNRIETSRPFVAEYQDAIVGFIELEPNGYIDCFYVDPTVQSSGIGGMLYQQIVNEARGFGIKSLTVDASLAVQPFFEKRGFKAEKTNQVSIDDQTLTNTTMALTLD